MAALQSRTSIGRSRFLSIPATQFRAYTSTSPRRQQPFQSQTENTSDASILQSFFSAPPANPQTLTEKIVQRHADGLAPGKTVKSGDFVTLRPHKCMTHDNSWPVYSLIEEFANKHGVQFYPAGRGIGHQLMVEEGHAWPGTLSVASDSHSNHYGGIGCLGTPVVRTDASSILATGRTWWQVPRIAKITFTGLLQPGVTGKDIIVALCGLFNKDEVLNHCIEFAGSEQTLASIPIDSRLTVANMTTEFGGLSGLFPIDDLLISWYRAKATTAAMYDTPTKDRINHKRIDEMVENRLESDPGAIYAQELYMNLSTLAPFVSGPNSVKIANPLKKLEAQDIAIDKAYLVSCTNSRASDLAAAARVIRQAAENGSPATVNPRVKFYIAAASSAEQKIAEDAGDWQVLLDAGAIPLISGCAMCIGLGEGLLEENETGISASNRNYVGRMGHKVSQAYLASPEVVAASALQGKIAGPGWYNKPEGVEKVIIGEGSGDYVADKARSTENALDKIIGDMESLFASAESGEEQPASPVAAKEETLVDILPGFPEKIEGEIVFCDQDSINTDGIYPGYATYQDGLTPQEMAEVCMVNYDAEFRNKVQPGDILISGFNFGCGSSREQAATAILASKIPLVVSGSFGNIFGRNSINNALLGLEVPQLVERLREAFKDAAEKPKTRRTGWKLLYDVRRSKVVITEKDGSSWEEKVGELPITVQEIVALGGLEGWIRAQIKA
ncbi:hypothetical protein G7046_g5814 [Stylonectria norvegica]|nr:hypothetical protein G7046_g5814 [Stylonectria norvegica]